MRALYIYDVMDTSNVLVEDTSRMESAGHKVQCVSPGSKCDIQEMLGFDMIVLPDDVRRFTTTVEKAQQVARIMGIPVLPITAFFHANPLSPATDAAASQQQMSVVGKTIER